jgi:HK97 family phage prohead protease
MTTLALAAAAARAQETAAPSDRPRQRRASEDPTSRAAVRVKLDRTEIRQLERDGLTVVHVGGYASTTEAPYEMHDYFGPYTEVVSAGAFAKTLTAAPLVEFTVNHGAGGGLPMAHTRNATLDLAEVAQADENGVTGLRWDAYVDPTRTDVADMLKAMERGDLAEASFKFRITKGVWSPDYTEFRIDEVDLERGDVSAVNFGANPAATSGLRAAQVPTQRTAEPSATVRALLALSAADDVRR